LKKMALMIVTVLAIVLLNACDGQQNENEVQQTPTDSQQAQELAETPAPQEQEQPPQTAQEEPVTGSGEETEEMPSDSFSLEVNGFLIEMDQDINYVLAALGEPNYQLAVPSCAFDGEDLILRYDNLSIQIHTYPMGDNDFVQTISLRDDNIRTSEGGIRIGASYEDVVAAYGNDYVKDFNMYTFTRGRTTLEFFIPDGRVEGITFGLIFET